MILNAVMCVWNEEDIIESTVRHCFAQGCTNVFIVDNDSTDRTVDIAVNAGATLATTFKTQFFDEDKKVAHLNATVDYVNSITPDEQIWWMYLDADEFPNFDCELSIVEVLKTIDPSIRAIHGSMYDHIPTHYPYHVSPYHPADFQPICSKTSMSKVPLLRYDKNHPHLFSIGGAHDFITHGDTIPVMKDALQIHHFPYRNPEVTFARTKKLAETRNEWYKRFLKQVNAPNAVAYEERYRQLKRIYKNDHLELKTRSLIYDFKYIKRQYSLGAEKKFTSSIYDASIQAAVYYYFLGQYDLALCRFKDALDACEDVAVSVLLWIKLAECFAASDMDTAHAIISDVLTCSSDEITSYIDENYTYILNKSNKLPDDSITNDMVLKVELYTTVFPPAVADKYKEIMDRVMFSF